MDSSSACDYCSDGIAIQVRLFDCCASEALTAVNSEVNIKQDITKDKPSWPLSCYSPSKYENTLITGFDESPEELRVNFTMARQSGTIAAYVSSPLCYFG